jgi:hypothetical protein
MKRPAAAMSPSSSDAVELPTPTPTVRGEEVDELPTPTPTVRSEKVDEVPTPISKTVSRHQGWCHVSATPSFRSQDIERVAESFSCRYNAVTEPSLALSSPTSDSIFLMMDCLRSVVQMLLARNGGGGSGERHGDLAAIVFARPWACRRSARRQSSRLFGARRQSSRLLRN